MLASQQHKKQRSQCVNIGCSRQRRIGELLRSCVFWSQRTHAPMRQRVRFHCVGVLEQPGDAEVQQLDHACVGHQHIRRLDVAMNDQMLLCVRNRGEHVNEHPQASSHRQRPPLAVAVYGFARDILEREIRPAVFGRACIQEPCDVRMRQSAEQASLAIEARREAAVHGATTEKLDGAFGFEAAVTALGEPHLAHAAASDESIQDVRTDARASLHDDVLGIER